MNDRPLPEAPAEAGAPLHYQRANEHMGQGRWEAALAEYDRAIALDGGLAKAHCNRGVALLRLNRRDEALASYDRAIQLNPGDALSYFNRAALQRMLGDGESALASYDQAIARRIDYGEAHFNRAVLLLELKRWELAIAGFRQAMALNETFRGDYAWFSIGSAQLELGQWQAALDSMDRAIALRGDFAEAHYLRGTILNALSRSEEAIASFNRAIGLNPDHALALQNLGTTLHNLKRHEEAIASYDRAFALRPDLKYLPGIRRYARMQICDWSNLETDLAELSDGIRNLLPVSPPFTLLALLDSAPLLRTGAQIWAADVCPPSDELGPCLRPAASNKIRVGYFSADFRLHPVALLTAGVFEAHDRSKFDITAFAFGPKAEDAMRTRLERAFDRFIDVGERSDAEVAKLARSLNIDIAVDLGGFTEFSRARIFSMRAAPLQVGYIGYLGTMNVPFMDYLVADATIIPAADQRDYSEKIIYLPVYHANDARHIAPGRAPSREELGIRPGAFVFACCNSNYKIMPATFDGWMRILGRVDGSILFLTSDNPAAERNLRLEAARRDIDPGRLVFGKRLLISDYLARYAALDLFLDTLPYNAGTTASDALWAGLPVITRPGGTFPGRVAASLLKAVGLPELIAATQADYEELAVQLATDPERMTRLRRKLEQLRASALLFNTRQFTSHVESAYARIHARYLSGLPADHIHVDPGVTRVGDD
jgi:predicted O-linked N-acetylglucosamine transferase (SPINDLY family)